MRWRWAANWTRAATSGWFWLSTQEQVALARLGKALMADQAKLVSGQWKVGDDASDVGRGAASSGALFDYAALARGVQLRSARPAAAVRQPGSRRRAAHCAASRIPR